MKILLDTHYLLWAFIDTSKISKSVYNKLLSDENEIFYSQASLWEISIKYNMGKLSLKGMGPEEFYKEVENSFFKCRPFKNDELIKNSIQKINQNLYVSELSYTISIGQQKESFSVDDVKNEESFEVKEELTTEKLSHSEYSQVKYDLIGKIAANTILTRNTIVKILSGISAGKFNMLNKTPRNLFQKFLNILMKKRQLLLLSI